MALSSSKHAPASAGSRPPGATHQMSSADAFPPHIKLFLQLDDGSRLRLRKVSAGDNHLVFALDTGSSASVPVGLSAAETLCNQSTSRNFAPAERSHGGTQHRRRRSALKQWRSVDRDGSGSHAGILQHGGIFTDLPKIADMKASPTSLPLSRRRASTSLTKAQAPATTALASASAGNLAAKLPPSGRVPDMKQKVWCTHWIGHGECSFQQQGCIYKHEMPDIETLRTIGFREVPQWYQKKHRNKLINNKHGRNLSSLASGQSATPEPLRSVSSGQAAEGVQDTTNENSDLAHKFGHPFGSKGAIRTKSVNTTDESVKVTTPAQHSASEEASSASGDLISLDDLTISPDHRQFLRESRLASIAHQSEVSSASVPALASSIGTTGERAVHRANIHSSHGVIGQERKKTGLRGDTNSSNASSR